MQSTRQKNYLGKVLSTKTKGMAVVEVEGRKSHRLYPKTIKRTKKFHAVNTIEAIDGQYVRFIETRPVSRTIRWKLTEIISPKLEEKTTLEKEKPKKTELKKPRAKKAVKK
jgi:small subunit ribosomal protein S17